MRTNKQNFLDFIPAWNPEFTWSKDEKGNIVVHAVNKGFYNWLTQKLLKRPRISHISLDDYGSFVWQQIDGKRTVYDISQTVKTQFGSKAEPIIDRMVRFIELLYQNKFIGYVKEKNKN